MSKHICGSAPRGLLGVKDANQNKTLLEYSKVFYAKKHLF